MEKTLNVLQGSFHKGFQKSLLAHLARCEDLVLVASGQVEISDFELDICKVVWEAIDDYYVTYKSLPSADLLQVQVLKVVHNSEGKYKSFINDEEYPALAELLEFINSHVGLNAEYMKAELPSYLRWVRAGKIVDDFKVGRDLGQDPLHMIAKLSDLETIDNAFADKGPKFTYATEDPEIITDIEDVKRVGTGIVKLDTFLDGGLQPGELGQVTACPGVGKTNILTHFCAAASLQGIRTLMITLELPAKMIKRRYLAMCAGIPAKLTKIPATMWAEEDLNRLALMLTPSYPAYNMCAVADHSYGNIALSEIEDIITEWKADSRARYGTDNRNLLVCVDWSKYILPPRDGKKYEKDCDILTEVNKQLGFIAKRQGVVVWIANQGTREADGKLILGMKDTAFAYHSNDALDVAISAALAETSRVSVDNIDKGGDAEDRRLVFSIPKNRTGQVGAIEVYQAPTLRFFDSDQDYHIYMKALKASAKSEQQMYEISRPKQAVISTFATGELEDFKDAKIS